MKQIKVINYGLSNLLSVQRAFEHLGAQAWPGWNDWA